MDLQLARHQWADGRRAVERARSDSLNGRVAVITAELNRRVGQNFTLDELAAVYAGADRWALEAVHDAFPDDVPSQVSTAADAAFDLYSRRASDYSP